MIHPAADSVLREALDQYVTNHGEFVETSESVTDADRSKLTIAESMLDTLNERFVEAALTEDTK